MRSLTKNNRQLITLSLSMALSSVLLIAPQAFAMPTANADTITTDVNQSITFNPMQNDRADSGTWIYLHWATQPESANSGTSTFTGTSVTYTPPRNFSGTTRFWYSLEDSTGARSGAHITVNVGDVEVIPPYPIATNDNLTTDVNTPLIISPLVNDTGDELTISFVNAGSTQGSQQQIIGTDQISYTPSIWASGEDSFWYRITDSLGRVNAAMVTVSVTGTGAGAYPTAGSDNYTVDRNSTNNTFDVFANDTGSGLTFNNVYAYSQNGGRTFNNGTSIRYDAPTNFTGTDEFWYSMQDSIGRTNSARVRITVTNTGNNNAEPDAVEDALGSTINADEFEIDVLANDTDPDNDTLTVQSITAARSGTSRLSNGRVFYTPPSTTESDTFEYTISDGQGGTASASVTIGVRDPDNPNPNNPTVVNENLTLKAGETVIIKVLENDSDADGDTISLDQVTSGSQGGTTVKVPDENGDLNWVEYTSLSTATGSEEFWYGVPDGRGGNAAGRVIITFR